MQLDEKSILADKTIMLYDLETLPFYFSFNYGIAGKINGAKDVKLFNTRDNTLDEIKFLFQSIISNKHKLITIAHNNENFDGIIVDYLSEALFDGRINNFDQLHSQVYQIVKSIREAGFSTGWKVRKDYAIKRINNHFDSYEFFNIGLKELACRMGRLSIIETDFDDIDESTIDWEEFKLYEIEDVLILDDMYTNKYLSISLEDELIGKLQVLEFLNQPLTNVFQKKSELGVEAVIDTTKDKPKYPSVWACGLPKITFTNPQLKEAYNSIMSFRRELTGDDIDKLSINIDLKLPSGKILEIQVREGGIHGAIRNYVNWNGGIDIDADSFYPFIMLVFNFISSNIIFQKFKDIVYDRIKFKKEGNPLAKVYKIIINAIYGKTGQKSSSVYSPDVMLNVTVGGQILLLKLTDMLLQKGIDVIYLNTDGLTIEKTDKDWESVVKEWERVTKINCSVQYFDKMFIRDVNNFINVGDDGKLKTKGTYSLSYDKKSNGWCNVVIKSLHNYIETGELPKDYIYRRSQEGDIREFTMYMKGNKNYYNLLLDRLEVERIDNKDFYKFDSYTKLGKVNRWVRVKDSTLCIRKWEFDKKEFGFFAKETGAEKVLLLNDIKNTNAKDYNLDLAYYYQQCDKHMMELLSQYDTNPKLSAILKDLEGVYV